MMENKKLELEDIIENPEQYFSLRPELKKSSESNYLRVNIQGYSELFGLIEDLLRTAMFAVEGMENSIYYLRDGEKCIAGHLKVIEMLLPSDEGELLDILYRKYSKIHKEKNES
jgi:hypothetical protein